MLTVWLALPLLHAGSVAAAPSDAAGEGAGSGPGGAEPIAAPGGERSEAEADQLQRATRGLLLDLERILSSHEGAGWFLDQQEIEEAYPLLLESVCRTSDAARQEARAVVAKRARLAGDPQQLFDQAGELDDATEEALHESRALALLDAALDGAAADCPFWVKPGADFTGRQTDNARWTLNLETGGVLQVRQTDASWTYGGGGAGRILAGKNFGGPVTLLFGGEFGGGAMLKPRTDPSEFVLNYFPAVPMLLRYRDGSWHYEVEAAAVSLFQADNGSVSFGGRIGAGFGLWALRTRSILPWAGFAVAYEHYPANGGRERAHFFRGGLRVGFAFDGQ